MSAAESRIRVLVIEDEPDSVSMIRGLIERSFSADVETAGDALQARNRLEADNFDIVTLDYKLADDDGLHLLEEITASRNHARVIMITGQGDEKTASHAFKAGASDYVVKDRNLASSIVDAFQRALAETSLRRSQDALEKEKAFAETILNTLPDSFCMFGADGKATRWNEAFKELTGYSDEEIAAMTPFDFHPEEDVNRMLDVYSDVFRTGHRAFIEIELKTRDGGSFPCMLSCGVLHDNDGNVIGFCGIGRDITEQKQSETTLHNIIKETNQRREEITSLLESTRSILEHEGFEMAAREVFGLCGKLIGAGAGYVALVSEDGRQSTILSALPGQFEDRVGTLPHMPISRLSSKAFSSGRAVYENAFMESKWAEELPEGHQSINNILYAPLIVEGKALGVIVLANKPGGFSSRDALMASAFGEIASIALRNSRIMEALERSEEKYRSLFRDSPVSLWEEDFSDTKRHLDNLRDSGVINFREYFNDHPEVVMELARSVKVMNVNRATLDIYKAPDEKVFMRKLDQFFCEESYDLIREELVAISEGKTSFRGDGVTKDLDGNIVQIAIKWSVSPGSEETFSKVVVSIVDITEQKAWEQDLQMLNTELEGYAHVVSHNLKGPLSSILAASVTLRRLVEAGYASIDLPGIREMTRIIETNVTESDQLIENLLELAEVGQKPVEVSEVDVTEMVNRVLGERATQVSERRVKVIKGDDMGRVIVNSTHLYQLFSNLIDNAIKHNDSDEPALTISYLGEESPGAHRYLVRDNGSGFNTRDMEIMFKPFYSGKRGEYGIGLATVRKIIDVYCGTINTYNDGGACFEFVIKDIR